MTLDEDSAMYVHVVWWTHQTIPPRDRRGDWSWLLDSYSTIAARFPALVCSPALHRSYLGHETTLAAVALSWAAARHVEASIKALIEGDRILEGTRLHAVRTSTFVVEVVLEYDPPRLPQIVGRLKSRTATLLSFEKELGIGGASTWGSGFWHAVLPSDQALAGVIESVVRRSV